MHSYKFSAYLLSFSLISFLILILFLDYKLEIFSGLITPLLGSLFSSNMIYKIFHHYPKKLTSFMVKSFFLKMFLYGFILILIFNFSSFNQPVFFISFIGYFIVFHLMEALFIKYIFNKGSTSFG